MIRLSAEAEIPIDRLIAHCEARGRIEAARNLLRALEHAQERIAASPEAGLDAPRPYPSLRASGRRWIVEGRYWVAYTLTTPPIITGIFHVAADIPNRL